MRSHLCRALIIGFMGAGVAGCETNTETGALVGGGGGALVGGTIGSLSHSRAGEGALIGAAVGAIGGALVGNQMDRDQRRDSREISNESEYDRRHPAGTPITKADVINWTSRGVSEDTILNRIDRSGTVFHLTAADINDLRDKGVSSAVIDDMRGTSER